MSFFHLTADASYRHQHDTVAEAYECEAITAEAAAEVAAELAVERYLENQDWAETAAFEDYERRMGKVSYEQARDAHALQNA